MSDKVVWESVKWPDGSRYEGLVKNDKCHVRGVFSYADGDKYMGEYIDNNMDGYGVYVWQSGTIYRGQWSNSMMHGCGVKISKQPNNGQYIAEEGVFKHDEWLGSSQFVCSVDDARKAAAKADTNAQMAMVFELHHTHQSPSTPGDKKSNNAFEGIKSKIDSVAQRVQETVRKLIPSTKKE